MRGGLFLDSRAANCPRDQACIRVWINSCDIETTRPPFVQQHVEWLGITVRTLIFILPLLVSCSAAEGYDSGYDRGYSDGYATGYNTTCEIRATMISGDWDTKGYKPGYDTGYEAGSKQCKVDQPRFR